MRRNRSGLGPAARRRQMSLRRVHKSVKSRRRRNRGRHSGARRYRI